MTLAPLTGLVVIDEVQRQPELFTVLRPLVDRPRARTKYLLLGSAAPELVRGVSESLAGRVGFVDLSGFGLDEVGTERWRRLWLRGGFPRSYLARSEAAGLEWRRDFMRTFLERDLPQLGIRIPAEMLRRFWTMVAHYHGQIWNGADLGRSLAVNEHTVRRYLDVLSGAFVVRQLPPWFENLGKRQYKSPKVYVRDSGLLHGLLSLPTMADLEGHPKYGASWEGFALEQVLSAAEREMPTSGAPTPVQSWTSCSCGAGNGLVSSSKRGRAADDQVTSHGARRPQARPRLDRLSRPRAVRGPRESRRVASGQVAPRLRQALPRGDGGTSADFRHASRVRPRNPQAGTSSSRLNAWKAVACPSDRTSCPRRTPNQLTAEAG